MVPLIRQSSLRVVTIGNKHISKPKAYHHHRLMKPEIAMLSHVCAIRQGI
jgi:hypothetical protein